jgi:hypothetical protein
MALNVEIITPPATEPLTLPEIREHLRLSWQDEDNWLQNALTTARLWLEGKTGRALLTQTIRTTFDLPMRDQAMGVISGYIPPIPPLVFDLPYAAPLGSVSLCEIEKDIGSWQALTLSTHYLVDPSATPARVWLRGSALFYWSPSLDMLGSLSASPRVRITYTAGYGAAPNSVPYDLRQTLLNAIGYLYANRDCGGAIPDDLLPTRLLVIDI